MPGIGKRIEKIRWPDNCTSDERNKFDWARAAFGTPGLAWSDTAGDLLAVELDLARDAHGVSIFSALAGLHPRGGRAGAFPHRRFALEPLAATFRSPIFCLGAGVVDF